MTTLALLAPLAGYVLPLKEVPDAVFAQGMAGDGVAIDPTAELLHAPCAGEVVLMPAGRHAVTVRMAGAEVLLHIGIDTVRLEGRGFELLVEHGAQVESGQPLVRFSLDRIARAARSAVTPVLLSGPTAAALGRRITQRTVAVGDFLMELHPAGAQVTSAPTGGTALRKLLAVPFDHGLHARPAALIVSTLKGLDVEVSFAAHGRDRKSVV